MRSHDPRSSYADSMSSDGKSTLAHAPRQQPYASLPYVAPQPSIRLLYSFSTRRDFIFVILPAICVSCITGGIAPFMTLVIGHAFGAFAGYPSTPSPPQSAKDQLLHDVGFASIELLALAVGSLCLGSIMSSLWIWAGERNVMRLRKRVYDAVVERDMEWFDTKMGVDQDADPSTGPDGEGRVGAGGLMAKFAKDTDDVRAACALTMGQLVQYFVTFVTCLVLAFRASWSLTLVILASVPITVLLQGFAQTVAGPIYATERNTFSQAGNIVSRAVSSIATVKAFNANVYETRALTQKLDTLGALTTRAAGLWGFTTALSQFALLSMFVQGFWFGATLVHKGKISFGEVVSVFWACLIAASNFQLAIPKLIILGRGKWAMVSLVTLIRPPPAQPKDNSRSSVLIPLSPTSPRSFKAIHRPRQPVVNLRKIRPTGTPMGEIHLRNVTFAYPTRPSTPAVIDVSLFVPSQEMTFIVGPSGSGKSTIAQLLLRMYEPTGGSIEFEDQMLEYLDEDYTKEHIAAVAQGCVLFDMSVHDNVAMGLAGGRNGRTPRDATREEVVEACRVALVHEFVRDLPDGYDTQLGAEGANLSGGQRQRLAIARAKLRDPTVLILDEATSALDPTSRHLVFAALRAWRKGKTTLVITHDLALIEPADFVYVMKEGRLVEQGYREELEELQDSHWCDMTRFAETHRDDALPPRGWTPAMQHDTASEVENYLEETEQHAAERRIIANKHASIVGPAMRPNSQWMFDVIADLTGSTAPARAIADERSKRGSLLPEPRPSSRMSIRPRAPGRRSSMVLPSLAIPDLARMAQKTARRASLQFSPTSPAFFVTRASTIQDDEDFEIEKHALKRSATEATQRRERKTARVRWDASHDTEMMQIKVERDGDGGSPAGTQGLQVDEGPTPSLWRVVRDFYPTLPNKGTVFLGIIACLISGAMTPLFSFLLSQLLIATANVETSGIGATTRIALTVLVVAFADGAFAGLKYFIMERAAFTWVDSLRRRCFARVLAQDVSWFDSPRNTPSALVTVLMKDGDDARALISTVLTQFVMVTAMLGVGFVWALVQGWQLTLAGLAIAPVFAVVMAVQARLIATFERNNKRSREEVAKRYHDAISNIRDIRCMSFEPVFKQQYDDAVDKALTTGIQGAFVEGSTIGVASALIYFAEAVLFYVGAVLIVKGDYTYLRMVEVLNLVAFTVTIAAQLLAFVERIAKAVQATHDFGRLLHLSTDTQESKGTLRPTIRGTVSFNDVTFAYPQRPNVPVLRNLNLRLKDGESVAVVGPSGSGKSTIAALLQRLYEPTSGSIAIGGIPLAATDVVWLREHVAIVSQNPHLFDASVSDNISYGARGIPPAEIVRAAQEAQVHDVIAALPKGYETAIGENATLLSGGQAQRLQLARALARAARILVLDECTSALDGTTEAGVLATLRRVSVGRTTLVVTHRLPAMQMCDRIVVVNDGAVAETGTYAQLMAARGVFYTLASAGEWAGS